MASGENDYAFGRLLSSISFWSVEDMLTSLGNSTNKKIHKCMFLGKGSPKTRELLQHSKKTKREDLIIKLCSITETCKLSEVSIYGQFSNKWSFLHPSSPPLASRRAQVCLIFCLLHPPSLQRDPQLYSFGAHHAGKPFTHIVTLFKHTSS